MNYRTLFFVFFVPATCVGQIGIDQSILQTSYTVVVPTSNNASVFNSIVSLTGQAFADSVQERLAKGPKFIEQLKLSLYYDAYPNAADSLTIVHAAWFVDCDSSEADIRFTHSFSELVVSIGPFPSTERGSYAQTEEFNLPVVNHEGYQLLVRSTLMSLQSEGLILTVNEQFFLMTQALASSLKP